MDKPYTIVQRDAYQLTIFHGIAPLDPENVDILSVLKRRRFLNANM